MSSKDPEDALFNQFPSALGYHTIALKEDEKVLSSFTTNIQEAIREIRTAYDDLINRTESVILKSFACSSTDFKKYKQEIILSLNTADICTLSAADDTCGTIVELYFVVPFNLLYPPSVDGSKFINCNASPGCIS